MTSRRTPVFVVVAALSACLLPAQTAPKITTPKEALGFNLGDDYQVANYTQLEAYWKKLAAESPRMKLESIGKTEEGRDQWMAVITSPENMKKLARYKEIARQTGACRRRQRAGGARSRARRARPSCGSMADCTPPKRWARSNSWRWVYQMVSRTDEETMRFLNDVIVLNVQANPDGQELVANWYMREKDSARSAA